MPKIVVALGGNALGLNPSEQKAAIKEFVPIIEILSIDNEIVIVHGNGPQVGLINNAFSMYTESSEDLETMPFAECGAMSQGYIGYHIQNALINRFRLGEINKNVMTCLTQVKVDVNDEAFHAPSKPIGMFYSEEDAKELSKINNWVMAEDSGRGYRRVVPSPKPLDIIEKNVIKQLVSEENILIACGGGGVPVVQDEQNNIKGVDAVIDKDFAAELLAELIDADILLILTAVDNVYINFGQENQKALEKISIDELDCLVKVGHFGKGSMLPKIQAALKFMKHKNNNKSIITSIEKAPEAIKGKAGTIII